MSCQVRPTNKYQYFTHAISVSVVIQSFGWVTLCFAASKGNTAPSHDGKTLDPDPTQVSVISVLRE